MDEPGVEPPVMDVDARSQRMVGVPVASDLAVEVAQLERADVDPCEELLDEPLRTCRPAGRGAAPCASGTSC